MKLYSWAVSPYSARVRMQVYAKGLADVAIEEPPTYFTPKFYQDHPIGRIPFLEIDGEAIPESAVIAEYLEEIHPEPSLLGATPRENARVRTLARIADIYLLNNAFMLAGVLPAQTAITPANEGIVTLLRGHLASGTKALDRMIGRDGFACLGRLTLADCALVPALFYLEIVLTSRSLTVPIGSNAHVAAYWEAIQREACAARILSELHRGVEERRELVRTGEIERRRAAARAARAAAEQS